MGSLRSLSLLILAVCTSYTRSEEDSSTPWTLTCTRPGYFLIAGSCREFYECYVWKNKLYSKPHECLPGMFFDEVYASCRTLLPSNSPPRCQFNTDNAATDAVPATPRPMAVSDRHPEATFNVPTTAPSQSVVSMSTQSPATDAVPATPRPMTVSDRHPEATFNVPTTAPSQSVVTMSTQSPTSVITPVTDDLGTDSPPTCNSTENSTATDDDDFSTGKKCTSAGTNETDVNIVSTTMPPPPPSLTLCDHISVVDNHTTLLLSPTLRESLEYQTQFNKLAKSYNIFLEKAQNNSLIWRTGEGIYVSIKNIYSLASEYEREFDRKFSIYQREAMRPFNTANLVEKIQREIRKLQEEIKANQEALEITRVPSVRKFFQNNIASKQEELLLKEQELRRSSKEARDLSELLYVLDSIKNDAAKVENLAKSTLNRLQTLSLYHASDLEHLEKLSTQVNASIHSLTEKEEGYKTELARNRETEKSINMQKETRSEELDRLNAANSANLKEIRRLQGEIDKKEDKFEKKVEILCDLEGRIKHYLGRNPTEEAIARACNRILAAENVKLDITYEETEIQKLLDQNRHNHMLIKTILSENEDANRDLIQLVNQSPVIDTNIQEAISETANLELLYNDLVNLFASARKAGDSLLEITSTLQKEHRLFEKIIKGINMMKMMGQAAETDQARQVTIESIKQELHDFKSEVAHLQADDVRNCA